MLLAIDEQPLKSRRDFYERLWAHRAGDEVRLRVLRDGASQQVAVPSADVEEFFA